MIALKFSSGCAPSRRRPLMKKVGVELAPTAVASSRSFSTCARPSSASRQAVNFASSRPASLAQAVTFSFRLSSFSSRWLLKRWW
jgi:hypothetical protein